MCFNNFLNKCAKTLNDSYFQMEGVHDNLEGHYNLYRWKCNKS